MAELLGSVSVEIWSSLGVAFTLCIVAPTAPRMLRAWRIWQMKRRIERDPIIMREEWSEYTRLIGEEEEPLQWGRLVRDAALHSAVFIVPLWLVQRNLDHVWWIACAAWLVLTVFIALWRRLNDPEPVPLIPPALREYAIPTEAYIGFFSALGIVAVVLALAVSFF